MRTTVAAGGLQAAGAGQPQSVASERVTADTKLLANLPAAKPAANGEAQSSNQALASAGTDIRVRDNSIPRSFAWSSAADAPRAHAGAGAAGRRPAATIYTALVEVRATRPTSAVPLILYGRACAVACTLPHASRHRWVLLLLFALLASEVRAAACACASAPLVRSR